MKYDTGSANVLCRPCCRREQSHTRRWTSESPLYAAAWLFSYTTTCCVDCAVGVSNIIRRDGEKDHSSLTVRACMMNVTSHKYRTRTLTLPLPPNPRWEQPHTRGWRNGSRREEAVERPPKAGPAVTPTCSTGWKEAVAGREGSRLRGEGKLLFPSSFGEPGAFSYTFISPRFLPSSGDSAVSYIAIRCVFVHLSTLCFGFGGNFSEGREYAATIRDIGVAKRFPCVW